mgnify:FL=1|tara:strand:- start:606 stop:815 length:210 start_codon:yes stop_codon:yes gene_type:complete
MNNQDLVNDILEYINCSMSNWYIREYLDSSRIDNISHLEYAIRKGQENHVEALIEQIYHLENNGSFNDI